MSRTIKSLSNSELIAEYTAHCCRVGDDFAVNQPTSKDFKRAERVESEVLYRIDAARHNSIADVRIAYLESMLAEADRLRTAIRQHREYINNQANHGPTEQADAALWSVLDA